MSPNDPSGNSTIQYFERGQFIGSRRQYSCGYSAAGVSYSAFWPNTAYFCPHCGEIWARAIYQHEFGYTPLVDATWITETRRCPEHGDGALLSAYYQTHLEHCSKELLHREALLLCIRSIS